MRFRPLYTIEEHNYSLKSQVIFIFMNTGATRNSNGLRASVGLLAGKHAILHAPSEELQMSSIELCATLQARMILQVSLVLYSAFGGHPGPLQQIVYALGGHTLTLKQIRYVSVSLLKTLLIHYVEIGSRI